MAEKQNSITAQAWERIGMLDDGMSREERDAKFRAASTATSSTARPNLPFHEAHEATFTPLHEEIHRLWDEDVKKFPPS